MTFRFLLAVAVGATVSGAVAIAIGLTIPSQGPPFAFCVATAIAALCIVAARRRTDENDGVGVDLPLAVVSRVDGGCYELVVLHRHDSREHIGLYPTIDDARRHAMGLVALKLLPAGIQIATTID